MIDFGADPKLCSEKDQWHIEQLLTMCEADYERLAMILKLAGKPNRFHHLLSRRLTYQERKEWILKKVEIGADLLLCSKRERQRIENFLSSSRTEAGGNDARR